MMLQSPPSAGPTMHGPETSPLLQGYSPHHQSLQVGTASHHEQMFGPAAAAAAAAAAQHGQGLLPPVPPLTGDGHAHRHAHLPPGPVGQGVEPPKPRFLFRMPKVVPNQKERFETDDLMKKHSREGEVRYTAFRDRPIHERQAKFISALREGHTEIAFTSTGFNLVLSFNPSPGFDPATRQMDFEKEPGKVHVISPIILNGVCVRWKGHLDLERLDGAGALEFDTEAAEVENAVLREQVEAYNRRMKEFEEHRKQQQQQLAAFMGHAHHQQQQLQQQQQQMAAAAAAAAAAASAASVSMSNQSESPSLPSCSPTAVTTTSVASAMAPNPSSSPCSATASSSTGSSAAAADSSSGSLANGHHSHPKTPELRHSPSSSSSSSSYHHHHPHHLQQQQQQQQHLLQQQQQQQQTLLPSPSPTSPTLQLLAPPTKKRHLELSATVVSSQH